ncbi:hypothetical protein K488DRAFT_74050 [Vararia minispora EC-137]|uniref:Uncharacterized protein n=1 Tax=Vararia minispora EC-137 TaxID=1314806 RepID=A0ACB8Q8Q9_9AGAM|nr:hypothetical protein K488DRAFT_74050 [Vararia minispora EC-137]
MFVIFISFAARIFALGHALLHLLPPLSSPGTYIQPPVGRLLPAANFFALPPQVDDTFARPVEAPIFDPISNLTLNAVVTNATATSTLSNSDVSTWAPVGRRIPNQLDIARWVRTTVLEAANDVKDIRIALLSARSLQLEAILAQKTWDLDAECEAHEASLYVYRKSCSTHKTRELKFKTTLAHEKETHTLSINELDSRLRSEHAAHHTTRAIYESKLIALQRDIRRERAANDEHLTKVTEAQEATVQILHQRIAELESLTEDHAAENTVLTELLREKTEVKAMLSSELISTRKMIDDQNNAIAGLTACCIEVAQLRAENDTLKGEGNTLKACIRNRDAALNAACSTLTEVQASVEREKALRVHLADENTCYAHNVKRLAADAEEWRDRAGALAEEKARLETAVKNYVISNEEAIAALEGRLFIFEGKLSSAHRVITEYVPGHSRDLLASPPWASDDTSAPYSPASDTVTLCENKLTTTEKFVRYRPYSSAPKDLQPDLARFDINDDTKPLAEVEQTIRSFSRPPYSTFQGASTTACSSSLPPLDASSIDNVVSSHGRVVLDNHDSLHAIASSPNATKAVALDEQREVGVLLGWLNLSL